MNESRTSPYVCNFISHWHSCTSVFRPGTFLVCCAFTSTTRIPMLFQNVVQRDPIHSRCLHGHRIDPARLQPFRHLVQSCRPATEFPHRIQGPDPAARPHSGSHSPRRSPPALALNDESARDQPSHFIPPPQLSSLFAIQMSSFNRSKVDIPRFAMAYSSSLNLDRGSARLAEKLQTLQRGRPAFFKAQPRHQSIRRNPRSHAVKRAQGTKRTSTIAPRALSRLKTSGRRSSSFWLNILPLRAPGSC